MKITQPIKVMIDYGFGPENIKEETLYLVAASYVTNGNLAVEALDENGENFSVVTVNLGEPLMPGFAFIDTNNSPWAEKALRDAKIAKPAANGARRSSGFCTYPLYEFDMTKFNAENPFPGNEEAQP